MRRLVLLLALAGCASPRIGAQGEHSTRACILALPLASQSGAGNGGLGCLGLLLRYHGCELDGEAEARFPAECLDAVTARELRDYLRGRGFAAEAFGGDLSPALPRGLLGYLERGHPAIVQLGSRFVLAYGFDPVSRRVLLADPLSGRRDVSYDELEKDWKPAGRLMLVAAPAAPL